MYGGQCGSQCSGLSANMQGVPHRLFNLWDLRESKKNKVISLFLFILEIQATFFEE